MLGTFLGVLAVALAIWLYQLQGADPGPKRIRDRPGPAVEDLGDSQRLAMDTLIQKIGGDKPEEFLERYNKAARDRDEAKHQLLVQRSITERLGGQAQELEKRAAEMDGKLASTRKDLEKYENDAKEAPKLRERIASLEESVDRKQHQLDELAPLTETDVGKAVSGPPARALPHPVPGLHRLGPHRGPRPRTRRGLRSTTSHPSRPRRNPSPRPKAASGRPTGSSDRSFHDGSLTDGPAW